jgi:hypothetical protein
MLIFRICFTFTAKFLTFSDSGGKSADILNSKSQLIRKSYLNMEGIDLFVKILVFVKSLYLRKGRKRKI